MTMDNKALKALIDKYFDGLTSDSEEAALRHALASPSATGAEVNEARAVLGVFAATRKARMRRLVPAPVVRYAAAVLATVLCIAAWHITKVTAAEDEVYLSYVDGRCLETSEPVMAIMAAELSALGEAETSVHNQFNEILTLP